jgi:hypothetical protein
LRRQEEGICCKYSGEERRKESVKNITEKKGGRNLLKIFLRRKEKKLVKKILENKEGRSLLKIVLRRQEEGIC